MTLILHRLHIFYFELKVSSHFFLYIGRFGTVDF